MSRYILFVVDEMIAGGGPVVCYNLIKSLEPTKFKPCVVTLFSKGALGERLESTGIPFLCLNLKNPFNPLQIKNSLSHIILFAKAHDVCLLHAHLTASGLYAGLAAKVLHIPVLFTVHGELSKRFFLRLIEIGVKQLFETLVGVSHRVTEEMRRFSFLKRNQRVLQIYNGIDTSYWACETNSSSGITECFPKSDRGIHITMVANFFIEKDHYTAIESFRLFYEKYNNSFLILIGDGEKRTCVEKWTRDMKFENVIFTGRVEVVRAWLTRTDIFVLASTSEGISIAVLEAMSMGLPVVASDVGGMREIITHEVNGILVPPKDPVALFEAMDRLVQDSIFRKAIRNKARERVVSTFSLEAMVGAYHAVYQDLLAARR